MDDTTPLSVEEWRAASGLRSLADTIQLARSALVDEFGEELYYQSLGRAHELDSQLWRDLRALSRPLTTDV